MREHQHSSAEAIHQNPYHWVDTGTRVASPREVATDTVPEVLYDANATEHVVESRPRIALWRHAVLVVITGYAAFALIALVAWDRNSAPASMAKEARPAPVVAPVVAPANPTVIVAEPAPIVKAKEREHRHARAQTAKSAPRVTEAVGGRASTASDLLRQYQRVGRDLLVLENTRGAFAVKELTEAFKEIKISDAEVSREARIDCAEKLDALQGRIDRHQGIQLSQECLNNPLAAGCQ